MIHNGRSGISPTKILTGAAYAVCILYLVR